MVVNGIHMKTKKVVVAAILGLALVTGLPGAVNSNMTESNPYVTYAKGKKKDKKAPVIKLNGKSTMTVEVNKSVKIPKATAKDNVDGNVTKKMKITVKKKNKKYSSIAKKIKNNKGVKFTSVGDYIITYKVTDKAGNIAVKTRKVKVLKKENIPVPLTEEETTEIVTTETPTTEATTEIPTTEATTEAPTPEQPTIEKPTTGIYQETVNGITYNVTRDFNLFDEKVSNTSTVSDKITINIENDYDRFQLDANSGLTNDAQYLKFLGKITATDENGNDISDNIVIVEIAFLDSIINSFVYRIYIYVEDINGNSFRKDLYLYFRSFDSDIPYMYDDPKDLIKLSDSPLVYGRPRVEEKDLSSDEE